MGVSDCRFKIGFGVFLILFYLVSLQHLLYGCFFYFFKMIIFNGNIINSNLNQLHNNRSFLFYDAVFETLNVVGNKILFFEDHYFRLMSSMRILRMEIPMNFTMEFLEEQILSLISQTEKASAYRVRFTVFRDSEGLYLPNTNDV